MCLIVPLEGPARSVLTSLSAAQYSEYSTLFSAFKFPFGAKNVSNRNNVLFQNYYRQQKEESLSTWLPVLSYHDSDYTNVDDLQLL